MSRSNQNSKINQQQPQQQQQQYQQQQMMYAQQQQEIQRQEMIFLMQQDLENMVGVIADTQATIEFFRHNPEHQYVKVALNRLALQTNLSNGIISDLEQSKPEFQDLMQKLKKEMRQKFTNLNIQLDKDVKDAALHYCEKNLATMTSKQQMQQKPVKIEPQFNQSVVEKVIGGIQQVDQKMQNIRNGEIIESIDLKKLQYHYEKRQQNAHQKLKQNYGDEYMKRIQYQQQLEYQNKNNSNNQHQSKDPNQRRSQEPHQSSNSKIADQNQQGQRQNQQNGKMEVETEQKNQNPQQPLEQKTDNEKKYNQYQEGINQKNNNSSQIKGQNPGQSSQSKQGSSIKKK